MHAVRQSPAPPRARAPMTCTQMALLTAQGPSLEAHTWQRADLSTARLFNATGEAVRRVRIVRCQPRHGNDGSGCSGACGEHDFGGGQPGSMTSRSSSLASCATITAARRGLAYHALANVAVRTRAPARATSPAPPGAAGRSTALDPGLLVCEPWELEA